MALTWSDLNPLTWPGQVKSRLSKDFGGLADESESAKAKRAQLEQQGAAAAGFAGLGEAGYGGLTSEAAAARDYLRRIAEGRESIAAEQLRQGLEQNVATQRSLAASASPQNSAMAARTAAIQAGRLGAGMSGAAALAGIQERRAAQQALNDAILGARGQDIQVALGSRQNAIAGYGGITPDKSWLEKWSGPIAGGISAGAALSDERHKEDIRGGEKKAKRAIEGLKAYAYKYKDERNGKGEQLGPMAQDLEKAGLGHAVVDTPKGKYVDGAKAALSSLALVAALGKRVKKLEGKRSRK